MNKSLHILADLYDCRGDEKYLTKVSIVKKKVLQMVKRAGFVVVTSRFHKFAPGSGAADGGITGVIVVSESHLAIHTWPEAEGLVNVDIFSCRQFDAGAVLAFLRVELHLARAHSKVMQRPLRSRP